MRPPLCHVNDEKVFSFHRMDAIMILDRMDAIGSPKISESNKKP